MEPTDKVSLTYEQLQALGAKMGADIGKARVLTTADYNWPTDNPNGFALWKMEPGLYTLDKDATTEMRPLYYAGNDNSFVSVSDVNWVLYQGFILTPYRNGTSVGNIATFFSAQGTASFAAYSTSQTVRKAPVTILNNLTSTSTTSALAANQGKILKDLIDSIAIRGAGAPTTSTVGEVGQLYEDGTNGALYQLKSIDITTTPNTYNWEQVGGSSVNVVQTTGTSTTDVMSQDATTKMIYPTNTTNTIDIGSGRNLSGRIAIGKDSSASGSSSLSLGWATSGGIYSIAIGRASDKSMGGQDYSAKSWGDYSIAIGNNSNSPSNYTGSIALGASSGTNITANGMMDIGTSWTGAGYSSSNYRLLTGLYDPQGDHDAATKGYVDGLISALEARIAALEGN